MGVESMGRPGPPPGGGGWGWGRMGEQDEAETPEGEDGRAGRGWESRTRMGEQDEDEDGGGCVPSSDPHRNLQSDLPRQLKQRDLPTPTETCGAISTETF